MLFLDCEIKFVVDIEIAAMDFMLESGYLCNLVAHVLLYRGIYPVNYNRYK